MSAVMIIALVQTLLHFRFAMCRVTAWESSLNSTPKNWSTSQTSTFFLPKKKKEKETHSSQIEMNLCKTFKNHLLMSRFATNYK